MDCPHCHGGSASPDYEGSACDTCGNVGFVAPLDTAEIKERIARMTWDEVRAWFNSRMLNAQRIAGSKTGADQAGWLQDMLYFAAVVGILDAAKTTQHR